MRDKIRSEEPCPGTNPAQFPIQVAVWRRSFRKIEISSRTGSEFDGPKNLFAGGSTYSRHTQEGSQFLGQGQAISDRNQCEMYSGIPVEFSIQSLNGLCGSTLGCRVGSITAAQNIINHDHPAGSYQFQ